MVCFSQHSYDFGASTADAWFQALAKYHPGIRATVTIDDDRGYSAKIDLEWLRSLPKGQMYNVTTERTWNEWAAIQAMPRYVAAAADAMTVEETGGGGSDPLVLHIAFAIDGIIASRLEHGGEEIMLSRCFEEGATFEQLVSAIGLLKNTQKLTRFFVSRESERVILVLKDRYSLCAYSGGVSDMSLPTLDLDDGFVQNAFDVAVIPKEWPKGFKAWRVAFNESNGQTWDAPIITPTA